MKPETTGKLKELAEISSYQRANFIEKGGWDIMNFTSAAKKESLRFSKSNELFQGDT